MILKSQLHTHIYTQKNIMCGIERRSLECSKVLCWVRKGTLRVLLLDITNPGNWLVFQ